jgi:photosystem I reaction center subunit V
MSVVCVACRLAEEASFVLQTNDPEGFNIVDLLAYGSLGHALGFFLLACSSLTTKPIPF